MHSGKKTSLWFVASFYFQPKHAFKLGHWLYSPDWDSVKSWSHSHEVKSWSLRPVKVLPELSPTLVVRVSIHLLSLQSQWHGDSTAQMLNWSRLVFDWSWVHKDQGSEGHFYTSHMQALLHLYDSPDSVGFIHKYHSENEDHGIWSHQFMGNTWGNSGNSVRLYFGGLQSHWRWWLQPWN